LSSDRLIVDDLVILGRAVPEQLKNGRVTVCAAGYSHKLGFTRIFPTRTTMRLNSWNIVKVPLERDPRDSRSESWKIEGSKSEWDRLDRKIEVVGRLHPKERLNLIANLVDDCVKDINEVQRSLGIVKPTIEKCYFCPEEKFDPTLQATLFGSPLPTIKKQHREFPKIRYSCSGCRVKKCHDQTVLEWGFYEWMRKHPEKPEQVWENAQIFSPKHECFFFVGNMRDRRTAFLIISILRLRKGTISKPLVPFRK
jgi:hypothetical protein